MNKLFIQHLPAKNSVSLSEAGHILETQTINNWINVVNWESFSYRPKVSFRIGHTGNEIWLKYYVTEKHILAHETKINGNVYQDSCVEFFVSVDGKNYYNFEFSCIGTIHLAHGSGRGTRKFVETDTIKKIKIASTLGKEPFEEKTGNFEWEMTIQIPKECLAFDNIKSLNGLSASANFYKCGDATSEPHFLTWNPIKTEKPDYHRPEYFGKILFE